GTKTVKSFTLPNTSGVFAIAMDLTPAAVSTTTKVSLSSVDNIYGIGTLGVAVTVPNLDGSGSGAYATNLLGTSLSFGGASFSFRSEERRVGVDRTVVPLPSGKIKALKILVGRCGSNRLHQPL